MRKTQAEFWVPVRVSYLCSTGDSDWNLNIRLVCFEHKIGIQKICQPSLSWLWSTLSCQFEVFLYFVWPQGLSLRFLFARKRAWFLLVFVRVQILNSYVCLTKEAKKDFCWQSQVITDLYLNRVLCATSEVSLFPLLHLNTHWGEKCDKNSSFKCRSRFGKMLRKKRYQCMKRGTYDSQIVCFFKALHV